MSSQTLPTATRSHPASAPAQPSAAVRRRAARGWMLYDFANSAFVTAVITALAGPFLTALAAAAADPDGRVAVPLGVATWEPRAGSIYAYVTAASVLAQVLLLPFLGAAADRPQARYRLLAGGTAVGVAATTVLAAAPADGWGVAAVALLVANVAFGAAIVAYNAYLAQVAAPADRDKVSSRGFAAGYLGGGLLLAAALAALTAAPALGLDKGTVVRGAILAAGLWWGGFGWLALRRLAALHRCPVDTNGQAASRAHGSLRAALADLRRLPLTAKYLLSFLLFNDAIQAVVALSSVFLTQELYVARGLPAEDATAFLLCLILLIQFVAIAGALAFARLAAAVGAKRAVLVSLAGWLAVVTYTFAALNTHAEAWAVGAVIALVLGGSQALARSLFSSMVPTHRQSSFFAFYELAERGTAWVGSLAFAVTLDVTGSYRAAIFSLLVLLALGTLILARTDTDAAIAAARAAETDDPAVDADGDSSRTGTATTDAPTWQAPTSRELGYRTLRHLLAGLLRACTRTSWEGLQHVPAAGAALVAGNHLSVADSLVLADAVARTGRRPRMMGTAGLFHAPVVGAVLRHCAFIPVYRHSATPASALAPAAAALRAGQVVTIYPEGAITRHTNAWPARAKTGVVRLALDTGAPVVPVAQWGTLDLLGPEGTRHKALLAPLRRPRIRVLVGAPLDLRVELGVHSAAEASAEQLRAGADLIMDRLCGLLEELRGQARPGYAGRAENPPRPGENTAGYQGVGTGGTVPAT